ncbi:inositol monophosphatase family protein [Nocardia sp. NPDC050412]|uniref:inositol monophosphatase family protein n=1 Tax=Nocardia sp. NPDC050412 TaxID=3364320 RepID=UPI0037A46926
MLTVARCRTGPRHTRAPCSWLPEADIFLHLTAGHWDIAAVVPIVEEAGGQFRDLHKGRTHLVRRRRIHQRPPAGESARFAWTRTELKQHPGAPSGFTDFIDARTSAISCVRSPR